MTKVSKHRDVTAHTTLHRDPEPDRERRHDWIATCAYFLAEARGFTPEGALEDWLQAERAYMERGLAKGESN